MLAVKLREEILSAKSESELVRNLNPVISWDNYELPRLGVPARLDGREGDPEWFFSHSYPTSVIMDTLKEFKAKIDKIGSGSFPLVGYLGSGKSHVLMALFHIFNHPSHATNWFNQWHINFPEILESIIIPIPLQRIKVDFLWSPIFLALGKEIVVDEDDWPKISSLKRVIGKKRIIVLIDEIDNWYIAKNPQEQARIRGFLQSLSEASEDPDCQIILVVTFLGLSEAKILRDIVARPRGGSSIILQRTEDIFKIVRFRLFEGVEIEEVSEIIDHYLLKITPELERRGLDSNSNLKDELIKSYPFHPSFLRTLGTLKVRQLLLLLALIIKRKQYENRIITSEDLDDDLLQNYLHSLNSKMIDAYFDDLEYIKVKKEVIEEIISFKLSRSILISSLLNTLESQRGADFKEIMFSCGPNCKVQDVEDALKFLQRWTRLKETEVGGIKKYIMTTDLPVALKIERRAEAFNYKEPLNFINTRIQEILSSEITEFDIYFCFSDVPNDKRIKILALIERPLNIDQYFKSTDSFTNTNTLVLLYPDYSLKSDETIKLASRILACVKLTEIDKAEKGYEAFKAEYTENLNKQIKNAGWTGFRWSRRDLESKPAKMERQISNLKDIEKLIQESASEELQKYFLNLVLDSREKISIADLKYRFYRLEGAPMLLKELDLLNLVVEMVGNGEIAIETQQGIIIYKENISTNRLRNDNIIKRPPRDVVLPTQDDLTVLLLDKNQLTFNEYIKLYPFTEINSLRDLYSSIIDPSNGIYVIEEGKILSEPDNYESSKLLTEEMAAEILEPVVYQNVNERYAIKVVDLLSILKDQDGNSGVTENLILMIGNNLEIKGLLTIVRQPNLIVLQSEEESVFNELKRKIISKLTELKEKNKDQLIQSLLEDIPAEIRIYEDAIASLIDEEKIELNSNTNMVILIEEVSELESIEQEISTEEIKKKMFFRESGNSHEILELLTQDFELDEFLMDVRLEIEEDLKFEQLERILKNFKDLKIRIIVRRKPT